MSTATDERIGSIALPNITNGRASLWNKTKKVQQGIFDISDTQPLFQAFVYVWEHHREEADWFIKADDDTYVILENLKDLLRNYNSKVPIQFGHRFKYLGVGHHRFELTSVTNCQCPRDTWQGDQGMSFQRWRHFKILQKHREIQFNISIRML